MISSEYEICATLAKSGLFDAQFYLARYPDVAASGIDPVLHFVRYGASEGRACSPHEYDSAIWDIVPPPENVRTAFLQEKNAQTIPVVFAINKPFIKYFSVALASLLANFNEFNKLEIFILHNAIQAKNFAPILDFQNHVASIQCIDVSGSKFVSQRLHTLHYISIETYFRFLIPDLFPQYKRIIYLDSDLVINDDISKIFQFDINGYTFGGVHDYIFEVDTYRKWRKTMPAGSTDDYYNVGVMLLNLELIRKLNLVDKWMAEAVSGRKYFLCDQDIINIVCAGKIKLLPARWNFQWQIYANEHYKIIDRMRVLEYMLNLSSPAILHFNSSNKPWKYNDGFFARYFWEYAQLSPYYPEIKRECPYDPAPFLEDD